MKSDWVAGRLIVPGNYPAANNSVSRLHGRFPVILKYLLADEPTGSLDYQTGGMIMRLLEDLHHKHDLTSIYVTHNLSFAERSDRILKLDKGALEVSASLPGPAASKESKHYV